MPVPNPRLRYDEIAPATTGRRGVAINPLPWGEGTYHVHHPLAGAAGDGVADDSAAIQTALYAAAAEGSATVLLAPGKVYRATGLRIWPGVTLDLNGSTIKTPDNVPSGAFIRGIQAMDANGNYWVGADDSDPVTVRNGTLDGNRQALTPYTGYEREMQSMMIWTADKTQPGRLRVNVQDMVILNSVSDGCLVHTNVDYQESNVRYHDCFRGGLQLTGGWTRAQVVNQVGTGEVHPSGFRSEVDEGGFGLDYGMEISLTNLLVDFFYIGVQDSNVRATNVRLRKPFFNISGIRSVLRISNSEFRVTDIDNGGVSSFLVPGDCTLQSCDFILDGSLSGGKTNPIFHAINVQFNLADPTHSNQVVRILDCRFGTAGNMVPADALRAVYVGNDWQYLNNRVIIEGGEIPGAFTHGVYIAGGANVRVKDTVLFSPTAIWWTGGSGAATVDLEVDAITLGPSVTTFQHINSSAGASRCWFRRMELREEVAAITTNFGFLSNAYWGNVLVFCNVSPVDRLTGIRGWRARLYVPTAGQTYEWVCTTSGAGSAAVWKAVATVAA